MQMEIFLVYWSRNAIAFAYIKDFIMCAFLLLNIWYIFKF